MTDFFILYFKVVDIHNLQKKLKCVSYFLVKSNPKFNLLSPEATPIMPLFQKSCSYEPKSIFS